MIILSLATAALIILFPLFRVLLTLYVLVPVVLDRPPARHAIRAFRLSEAMRPWSMAEIFAIGCAVALVKVADLAHVGFGPAFWMFGILVVLVIAQDSFMCKWSVWNSLEHPKRSVSARDLGIVACSRCSKAWPLGTQTCARCGHALVSRDPMSLQRVWAYWVMGANLLRARKPVSDAANQNAVSGG